MSARSALTLGVDRVLIADAEAARLAAGDTVFTRVVEAAPLFPNNLEKSRLIDLVPAQYETVLYLDCDTHIMRGLGSEPAGQMQYNAGVIFYHLTDRVRAVLCRWRDLCRTLDGVHRNDQPLLTLAFEQLGFQPYVLSPQFNYRGLGELAVGPIRIWHSHDPVPPDLNDDEGIPVWPPRRFLNGQRVAW